MLRKLLKKGDANAALVGGVISVMITILVCIIIYFKISVSINGLGANGSAVAENVNTTASTVFTLAPIIAIVMIAGVILAVVMGFGRSNV